MAIHVQRHANVSKQATLLDGLDVSPLKWGECGCGLNRFVHEGMNHISNVKVHLKTHSGNVNIVQMNRGMGFPSMWYVQPAKPQISLCIIAVWKDSMNIKLLTEHHLECLSLKGGCTESSESTLFKMPHCWKSHVTVQLYS